MDEFEVEAASSDSLPRPRRTGESQDSFSIKIGGPVGAPFFSVKAKGSMGVEAAAACVASMAHGYKTQLAFAALHSGKLRGKRFLKALEIMNKCPTSTAASAPPGDGGNPVNRASASTAPLCMSKEMTTQE